MRRLCLAYWLIVGLLLAKPMKHIVIPPCCEMWCVEELDSKHHPHQQPHFMLLMCLSWNHCLHQLFFFHLVLLWVWLLLCPWASLFALVYFILQHRKLYWGPKGLANNVKVSVINVCVHGYNTNQIQSLGHPASFKNPSITELSTLHCRKWFPFGQIKSSVRT